MTKTARIVGITCICAVLCYCVIVGYDGYQQHRFACRIERMKADSASIVDWLMECRQKDGHYPDELLPWQNAVLDTYGYPWRYVVASNNAISRIEIGDYEKDEFSLIWSSDSRKWHMN